MLKYLFHFECLYQIKQRFFIGFALLFLFFGFSIGRGGYGLAKQTINSSFQVSYNMGLLSLGCVFAIMFFAISGMLRDRQYKVEPIIFSTAIKKSTYFLSRFLGVFVFSLIVFSFSLIGFLIGNFIADAAPEQLAAFELSNYSWAWLIIILPNIFICTSIVFSVSALTKNNIATYISAVSIYALYMICSFFFNSPLLANSVPPSPENMALAALADPFGLSAFFEQTQYWTIFEKNTKSISFSGYFMWSRLLWVSISSVLLAVTYRLFSFRTVHQKIKKTELVRDENMERKSYQPSKPLEINNKTQRQSFLSLLKINLSNVFTSLPFLALMLIWVVIVFTEIYSRINHGGHYNDSQYPTTNLMVWLIEEPLILTSLALIVFYSGEIIWKERNINFSSFIDSTPVSNITLFFAKLSTLLLLPVLFILTGILIAIGFQISKSYYQFEIWQYFSMFYFSGAQLFFISLLAFFVQSICNNKYLGMFITGLIVLLLGTNLSSLLGIYHPLLKIGDFPLVNFNNMNGYGYSTIRFHQVAFYWISLGIILSLSSFKLWRRGNIHQYSFRIKQLMSNWKRWQQLTLVVFSLLFILSGSFIFYNTNVVQDYQTRTDRLDFSEAYERKFKQYESLGRLYPIDIKTELDLFPDQNRYTLKANYLLENKNDEPVNQVFITSKKMVKNLQLENASLIERDTFFETYLFQLNEPLFSKERLKYSFEIIHQQKGYETPKSLVKNGSYIIHTGLGPALNYRSSKEIHDNFERQKRGLPKREEEAVNEDHLHLEEASIGKLPFETIVSTQADQTAIATGNLIKQWTKNGRNFYHYKTNIPVTPLLGYFSARYQTKKINHKGISIEQYYHPDHEYNIEAIEKNTKYALDYCIKNFGPYPFDHLRIAEIPGHWNFGGQAMPGTISMVEDRMYLIDNRDPAGFDLVAKRTIHEVAHQWWGVILLPKQTEGASFFMEGFAKYTEAAVMEKHYGKGAIWQLSETSNRRYFRSRTFEKGIEPPLYFSDGQDYLSYGKSYVVLLAMKELIGEENVNSAIRTLTDRHRAEVEPTLTITELLEEFYKRSPKKHHALIDDWLKKVITYDLKINNTSYKKLSNGQFEITLDISAKRYEQNDQGAAIAIDINEPIQIGLFKKHPRTITPQDEILYLKVHQVNKEKMTFKIIVNEKPEYIGIDPFGTRLDSDRVDNLERLQ